MWLGCASGIRPLFRLVSMRCTFSVQKTNTLVARTHPSDEQRAMSSNPRGIDGAIAYDLLCVTHDM
jgi:hypothetical protein